MRVRMLMRCGRCDETNERPVGTVDAGRHGPVNPTL